MKAENYTNQVHDSFARTDENNKYESAFRRWLVREIEEQKLTIPPAIEASDYR